MPDRLSAIMARLSGRTHAREMADVRAEIAELWSVVRSEGKECFEQAIHERMEALEKQEAEIGWIRMDERARVEKAEAEVERLRAVIRKTHDRYCTMHEHGTHARWCLLYEVEP